MTFQAKIVANCFLQRDFANGIATISPMKLQKLVYCFHGWFLAIEDKPVIDTHFQAWPYGPVEENLYHIFKPFGDQAITDYAMSWDGDEEKAFVVAEKNNEKFYGILKVVIDKYMPLSALQLSTLTHQPGTPWSKTREEGKMNISNDLIKEHFRGIVE